MRGFSLRSFFGLVVACAAVWGGTATAQTQGDVRLLGTDSYDPLYHGEQARRAFYDGYAITADFFYSAPDGLSALPAVADALRFGFHFDYALSPSFDLSAVFSANGGVSGNAARLNWVGAKYYWYEDGTDYALRVAVDPALDSGLGFRQTDVALLTSTFTSPRTGIDLGIGLRRLRLSYQEFLPLQPATAAFAFGPAPDDSTFIERRSLLSHVYGQEVHGTATYKWLFDLAESHAFLSVLGEIGSYEVLETETAAFSDDTATVVETPSKTGGGVLWVRLGAQLNRPSFQLMPSLSLPFYAWGRTTESADGNRTRLAFMRKLV